jgi:hypothetical protein
VNNPCHSINIAGKAERTDAKERDLVLGEGGTIETRAPPSDVSRDD